METVTENAQLVEAERGSYYTILGVGGDMQEWVDGYAKMLTEAHVGVPARWLHTTGAAVNAYVTREGGTLHPDDTFPVDLNILLFSLEHLAVVPLAMFRLGMGDWWFDDLVASMRVGH